MRSLFVVVLLVGASVASRVEKQSPTQIKVEAEKVIQCLDHKLNGNGNDSLVIEFKDPSVIDEIDIDLSRFATKISSGEVVLTNITLRGISEVQRNQSVRYDIRNNAIHVEVDLTWAVLKVDGSYTANVSVPHTKIQGTGAFWSNITNFVLKGVIDYTLPDTLKDVDVVPSYDAIDFDITGLTINGVDRSEVVSELVSKAAGDLVSHSSDIEAAVKETISEVLDSSEYAKYLEYAAGFLAVARVVEQCAKSA